MRETTPPQLSGEDDLLLFSDETEEEEACGNGQRYWKVLIVDDEQEVHRMTTRVLKDFSFEGKKLSFLHAYSGAEAKQLLVRHPDTALILLDVVMETDDAGLKVASYTRDELKNSIVQIILRTGQAGQEPEHQIIARYNINDYKSKIELTAQKLYTTLTASLRTFRLERSLKNELAERKQMEIAIRESERRFRDISHSMADLIWEVDMEGHYTFMSGNVKKILGYAPEELMGQSIFGLMDDDDARVMNARFSKVTAAKSPIVDLQGWIRAKDDTYVCVLTSGVPILGSEGVATGYRGISKDITAQKKSQQEKEQLEEQLRQAQKMESIGTLAGGIAHDFNNILGAIIGYSQLALYDLPEGGEAGKSIDQVLKAGNRAKNLVKQILAISRQSTQEKEPLELKPLIEEALSLLRASLPATIKITQDIRSDGGSVLADPTQIHQVMMNLCTNAAHAMEEIGGEMTVSLASVTMDEKAAQLHHDLAPGPYLKLAISDTGYGMDEVTQQLIFDPYFTTKEKGIGTGIGLSVVHGIVKGHGGTITVHSRKGKGTSFHVYFPKTSGSTPARGEADQSLEKGRERVLFIDDEAVLAELGRQMLQRLGYRVIAKTDSTEALSAFLEAPDAFDLVITDMTMPNLTGAALAKEVLKVRPKLPIILCTGYSNMITPDEARSMGIRDFLTKPLSASDLARSIRKALKKES